MNRGMDLPAPLAWLLDEAAVSPSPDRFLAELGSRLLAEDLPLAGGALTLALPHPIIARRTWMWRAPTGAVIEALGFAGTPFSQAGLDCSDDGGGGGGCLDQALDPVIWNPQCPAFLQLNLQQGRLTPSRVGRWR
jgi:hypothetical protein